MEGKEFTDSQSMVQFVYGRAIPSIAIPYGERQSHPGGCEQVGEHSHSFGMEVLGIGVK